jgi:5-methylcytosine-specific restriction endonuclease McrA
MQKQRDYRKTEAGRLTKRRATLAKYGIEPGHTEREWQRLLARHQGKCAYCGAPATEREHVVPLSRGGSDFIGNILPACRSCNNQKNNKFLIEWRQNVGA